MAVQKRHKRERTSKRHLKQWNSAGTRNAWNVLQFKQLEIRRVLTGPWADISAIIPSDPGMVFISDTLSDSLSELDAKLPVAGQSLNEVTAGHDFIEDAASFLETALDDIDSQLGGKATAAQAQAILFEHLGPGSNGADILNDRNGNLIIEPADIDVTINGQDVIIAMNLYDEYSWQSTFSTGLPGLPLNIDSASVDSSLYMQYNDFTFGITSGVVFLDTSPQDEVSFELTSLLTATDVSGDLGFLQIAASQNDSPSQFFGTLDVDIGGDLANGLSLGVPALTGDANVSLDLGAFLSTSRTANDPTLVPALTTRFELDWTFVTETDLTTLNDEFGDRLDLRFEDVTVKLRSVAEELLGPIVEDLKLLTDPLSPVLDILNTEVPLVSELAGILGGDAVTLLDLVEMLDTLGSFTFPPEAQALLDLVVTSANALHAVSEVQALADTEELHLGSFTFEGSTTDIRNLAFVDYTTDPYAQTDLQVGSTTAPAQPVFDQLDSLLPGGIANLLVPQTASNIYFDFSFPLFENPETTLFHILLGQDADLLRLDGGFGNGIEFTPPQVPLFSIGIATVSMTPPGLNLTGDFGLGYDTFGLRQFISGGPSAPTQTLLDGFYIDTDSTISLGLTTDLGIEGNYFFLSGRAAGEIGLTADMMVNPSGDEIDNDPTKTRFRSSNGVSEIGPCSDTDATPAILKLSGDLYAGLSFEVKVGVDIPFVGFVGVSFSEKIGGNIIDFGDFGCINPFIAPPNTQLASFNAQTGELRLNMGSQADRNARGFMVDEIDENYIVGADPNDPENSIQIAAFGVTQTFPRPTMITANADDGDDSIIVRSSIGDLDVVLFGGDDVDKLVYRGSGLAQLDGGNGDDHLVGGSGTNILLGAGGHDLIQGGYANTSINAIEGGWGDDEIYGGNGFNTIEGNDGDDYIHAGPNGDLIYGGNHDDHIVLGPGNDFAYGEQGSDTFTWFYQDPEEFDGNVLQQHDYIDGGAGGVDHVQIRASRLPDLITVFTSPGQDPIRPVTVGILSTEINSTLEIDNAYRLSLDGQRENDMIVVDQLYYTTLTQIAVNPGDTLAEYEHGDTTLIYGIDFPSTGSSNDPVETIHVSNSLAALTEECALVTTQLASNELENFQEFLDCEEFISGVTKIDLELSIDLGQPFHKLLQIYVTNQTDTSGSGNPEDHLYIDALSGDETIAVDSVTGPTTILGGTGNETITANLLPLTYSFQAHKYITNTYFGELNIDAGTGDNWFHFDASEYIANDGNPLVVGGFYLENDRIWGDEHIVSGIKYFATGGGFNMVALTANWSPTEIAVRSTRGNSITAIYVNNDDIRFSSTADLNGVGNGSLDLINGYVYIETGPIRGYTGQSNLHFSDRGAAQGNEFVGIARSGASDTIITSFAGAANDALIQINGTSFVGDIKIEGSDSSMLAEHFHFYGSNGNFVEFALNDGPDDLTVYATQVPLIIDAGAGSDTVSIGDTDFGGMDFIFAPVSVDGKTGFDDTLILDDRDSSGLQQYEFANGEIIRNPYNAVTYQRLDLVRLDATAFDDLIDLRQYSAQGLLAPNIELLGYDGVDSFLAPDTTDNLLSIDGLNQFVMNRRIRGQEIENIAGGNRNDTFRIVRSGGISGILYGGLNPNAGHDRIDYKFHRQAIWVNFELSTATDIGNFVFIDEIIGSPASTDYVVGYDLPTIWDVTTVNGGTISLPDGSLAVEFSSIEHLFGGRDIDLFSFDDGMYVAGGIDGTLGAPIDSLDLSRYTTDVTVNLDDKIATSTAGMNMYVVAVEAAAGGSGNDQLIGDNQANILFGNGGHDLIDGEFGDDFIDGGDGRDFLIGGLGSDTINGGAGEDIVVGSVVNWSVNNLQTILDFWSDENTPFDYQQRISTLYNGDLGNVWLNPTVVDFDDDADTLTGGSELDWFWIDFADSITDLETDEIFEEI